MEGRATGIRARGRRRTERHMNLETAAHLSAANAGELELSLRKIFAHGANLVVGWRYCGISGP